MICEQVATCQRCEEKVRKWARLQQEFLARGIAEHTRFMHLHQLGKSKIVFEKHVRLRADERDIQFIDIVKVIKGSRVIERNRLDREKQTSLLLIGIDNHLKPMHVVIRIIHTNVWIVQTAYYPESQCWKWNETFDARVCFCKHV